MPYVDYLEQNFLVWNCLERDQGSISPNNFAKQKVAGHSILCKICHSISPTFCLKVYNSPNLWPKIPKKLPSLCAICHAKGVEFLLKSTKGEREGERKNKNEDLLVLLSSLALFLSLPFSFAVWRGKIKVGGKIPLYIINHILLYFNFIYPYQFIPYSCRILVLLGPLRFENSKVKSKLLWYHLGQFKVRKFTHLLKLAKCFDSDCIIVSYCIHETKTESVTWILGNLLCHNILVWGQLFFDPDAQ